MHKPWLYIATLVLIFSVILGIITTAVHALISFSPIISFCSKFFPTTYKFQSIWLTFFLIMFVVLSLVWISLLLFSSYQYQILAKRQSKLPKGFEKFLKNYHISLKDIVYLDTLKHIAICYGFFSPKIYISKGLFKDLRRHEFVAVLLHEKYHMNKKHNLGNLVVRYISTMLFFIPLIKDIHKQYSYSIERLADEYVVKMQKTSDHLKNALAIFIKSENDGEFYSSFSMHIMERRVERILTGTQKKTSIFTKKHVITVLLSIGIFFLMFSPVLAFSATMHVSKEISSKCTGDVTCANICQQIEYISMYTPASFSQKLFSSN